jgi:hypothetical protein
MSHRVNVMIDESLWSDFQAIPPGERSRVLNEALAALLLRRRRMAAIARMAALRAEMPVLEGASEDWVREDRGAH